MEKLCAVILFLFLVACGNGNPAGDYSNSSQPIEPVMADTNNSFDVIIPLDIAVIASNPQRFAVRGKFIQIDPGSTGQANLRINTISDTSRLAYPGSQFSPGDFTDLYFDYIAQPGKFLHVLYGDSPDILSAGTKTSIDPALPNSTYINQLTSGGGIGVTQTIVTQAQNINGIKILGGTLNAQSLDSTSVFNNALSYLFLDNGVNQYTFLEYRNYVGQNTITKDITPLYIPPGYALRWGNNAAGGFATASIFLNYNTL